MKTVKRGGNCALYGERTRWTATDGILAMRDLMDVWVAEAARCGVQEERDYVWWLITRTILNAGRVE